MSHMKKVENAEDRNVLVHIFGLFLSSSTICGQCIVGQISQGCVEGRRPADSRHCGKVFGRYVLRSTDTCPLKMLQYA